MSKKSIIIISIVAFVLIVTGAVGALLWLNKPTKPTSVGNGATQTVGLVPDLSEDYGACNLLTSEQIKSTLGSIADNLGDKQNSGRIFGMNDTKSQNCTYVFEPSSATSGNINAEVFIYNTQSDLDAVFKFRDSDESVTKVSGLGEHAIFYETDLTDPARHQFSIVTYKGLTQYTLTITQSKDNVTFTPDTALSSLKVLAGQLKR